VKKYLGLGSSLLVLSLLLGQPTATVNAEANVKKESVEKVKTIGEVESLLLEHFQYSGMFYQIGSEEYVNYLTNLLIENADQDLALRIDYSDIRTYASTYLTELEKDAVGTNFELSDEVKAKKIKAIQKENKEKNENAEKAIKNNTSQDDTISIAATYNSSAAVSYAEQWGYKRNTAYNNHKYDCTNFASQAVYAGGKVERRPSSTPSVGITKTTSYWYSDIEWRTNYAVWREASSWVNVDDFFWYWVSTKGLSYNKYTTQSGVYNYASPGDIVQLQDQSSGDYYHTVVVTGKSNGVIYYSAHTGDRVDYSLNNVSASYNDFRVIKFVGTSN
jgi:Putative amidase domain